MPMSIQDFQLVSVAVASTRLGVSPQTVRRFLKAGKLATIRLGRRVLIDTADINRLVHEAKASGHVLS
jgi:excisionase family DNA binding protein